MNVFKRAALLAATIALTFSLAGCGAKSQIGYFDAERLMKESPQLAAIMDEGSGKLMAAQMKLTELNEKRGELGNEKYLEEAQAIEREMQSANQEYTRKLREKIDEILAQISKEKKLDAVVNSERSNRLVYHGGIDITDEMIGKLQ